MKKKIPVISAFLLILLMIITACNTNSLVEYRKASEKTEQIIKGQTAGEFTMTTEINPKGLTAEEIKELNYIKDMNGNFNLVFDDEEEKVIIRNYLNFGGLGYDFEVYVNEDQVFIKLPVVGKYLKINEEMLSEGEKYSENQIISEETKKEFIKRWLSLMNEEDVFKGKNIVLTTPDGEVKTREYTIKLKDEQIKALLKDTAEVLSRDESLKSFFDKNIRVNMGKTEEELKTKTFEEVLDHILKSTEEFKVDNFTYKASVDIDGYIVNEIIDISLKTIDAEKEGITGIRYHLDIKTWDINKDQKFEFPALTDENTLKPEEMKENMPSGIEDYFKIEI
ncbi:MAG TPA: hypothetical protein PLV23_04925 [Sedimentibacter sp.]|nr:hypothetical protein [Sedimentibacter sp.]HOK49972.1 hypothetical protein [Sedimentibacter sp.]HOW22953.1 hypothetical protein [Sedimentibacter sp.]HRC80010.1 hypothetical protein [Sedimentibacter sp.]